jgi:glucokinase
MIGVPGPVDESGQVLIFAEDLGWSDTPLARLVQAACGYPVALINRAQAGVWGERWLGTGKEQAADNLIYVSVSSGIGAGILLNGQLFTGAFGKAGELGHTTVLIDGEKCICGNHGCLETVASMRAVVQAVQTRFGTLPANQTAPLTAAQVIDRAKDGDSIAIQAVQEAGRYLGIAVANLIDLFNPATVIIGGQLAATGDLLLNPIREISQRRAFPLSYRHTQIVQNQLGPDSVCLGACTLVIDQFISAAVPALTPNDSIDTQ